MTILITKSNQKAMIFNPELRIVAFLLNVPQIRHDFWMRQEVASSKF